MREVINVLGIALIVFGVVAVVFITMNYATDNQTAIDLGPIEAPRISMPDMNPSKNEIPFVVER
jgi:hypothetical protein